MSCLGKRIRLSRLIEKGTGTVFMFAIDHGLSSGTVLPGLQDTKARVREVISGGANAVILTRGIARQVSGDFRADTAFVLAISATGALCPRKHVLAPVGTAEEALRLGADAVAVFVPLGGEDEPEIIGFLGKVGAACDSLGMPLILEAEYPATYDFEGDLKGERELGFEYLKHSVRLCAELGADLIEVNWPGNEEAFRELVSIASVPLVLAGGSKILEEEILTRIESALRAGAVGCCVGRNLFQHRSPEALARAIAKVVRERKSPKEALKELG